MKFLDAWDCFFIIQNLLAQLDLFTKTHYLYLVYGPKLHPRVSNLVRPAVCQTLTFTALQPFFLAFPLIVDKVTACTAVLMQYYRNDTFHYSIVLLLSVIKTSKVGPSSMLWYLELKLQSAFLSKCRVHKIRIQKMNKRGI